MAKKFLTLNIGAANVELAEYEASAKGALTLLNYGTARLAASLDGGDVETILSSALQEIMQSSGIRPGRVAISISGQLVFPRLAAIPMAGGAEKFAVMDGLDEFDEPQCVDVIVSNPPYIESAVCETLDPRVKDFEPRLALDGGTSGLDFYERYLSDAVNLLKPGGAVFFEIGENQGEVVRRLMFDCGFDEIRIEKDYAGHDRYASAILK